MRIRGNTKIYSLIGNPVAHTLSPKLHNALATLMGHNNIYVAFPVMPGNIEMAIRGAHALSLQGLNVTVPYKTDVIPYLKDVDKNAAMIGAVNTLVRCEDGYVGYNTDNIGLYRAMQSEKMEIEGSEIVILGAGGSARAAAFLCAEKNASRVFILNRTADKAKELASEVNKTMKIDKFIGLGLEEINTLPEQDLIAIQCTSVGMSPNVNETLIDDLTFYRRIKAGIDMIYDPVETVFMKNIKLNGGKAINGLKMLLYQGIAAYELWNQESVSNGIAEKVYTVLVVEANHKATEANKKENEVNKKENPHIILIGFMGSGKTTIGQKLADYYHYDMIDTDKLIVENQKKSIADIFESDGEEYFRTLETETLKELSQTLKLPTIIGTGGGMPINEANHELLRSIGKPSQRGVRIVYLKTSPETIVNRLKDDKTRPLLKETDTRTKVNELLIKRNPVYEEIADIIIETNNKTPQQIVDEISNLI